jgi:anti-anti-sigma factor
MAVIDQVCGGGYLPPGGTVNGTAALDPGARPHLDVGVQRLVGLVELSLDGTLDEHAVDQLCLVVEGVLADGATDVEVDCTELAGIDGFGLSLLLDLHRQLAARGGSLVLRYLQPPVVGLIRRARLGDVLATA